MADGDLSLTEELASQRTRIFWLLLIRLRYLHEHRTSEGFNYIGKDYVEDNKRVDCLITAAFLSPGHVDPFEFWLNGWKVDGTQNGNVLFINARRGISVQLWDDLRLKGIGQEFIIGYVTALMPYVNRHLLDDKYRKGHLLSRTFAVFEAFEITVTVTGRRLGIAWPLSLPPFPDTVQISGLETPVYVRDYIDAIGAYFRHEYDDCVRRVITATENFMGARGWLANARVLPSFLEKALAFMGISPRRSSTFRRRLRDNLNRGLVSDEVINSNLQVVYTTRNKIVHSGFRISSRSMVFCDKAVCSLYYLIADHCGNQPLTKYMFTLHQQFALQKSFLGQMYDLDRIATWDMNSRADSPILDSDDAIDKFFFESLRIVEADRT